MATIPGAPPAKACRVHPTGCPTGDETAVEEATVRRLPTSRQSATTTVAVNENGRWRRRVT